MPEVDEMGYIATHAVVYTTGRSLNQKNCAVLQAKTEILERELKDAKSALLDSQKNAEMQYNKGLDKGAEISRSAR